MTNLKLTKEQIEAIRAVSPELAEKLEAGEKVTVEKAVEKWEPKGGIWFSGLSGTVVLRDNIADKSLWRSYGVMRQTREAAERLARDQRIFNRLHAYRDEFAPGYVVPPVGEDAFTPMVGSDGAWIPCEDAHYRSPATIYFPEDVCEALCRKLNSGEVVL